MTRMKFWSSPQKCRLCLEPAHCSNSVLWALLVCPEVSAGSLQHCHYLCSLFLINSLLSEILCLEILFLAALGLPRQLHCVGSRTRAD